MEKIVAVIMGQDCKKFIGMCLESVKDADSIVYLDGGSEDNSHNIAQDFLMKHKKIAPAAVLIHKYNQEDKGMNGKQRNFYLDYVKKNYPGWWCLVVDPDEVVEDFSKIRNFINTLPKDKHDILWCIKMRHLVGDLGHEDATQPVHFVPCRLFKIRENIFYQEMEHPVLVTNEILENMDKLGNYLANIQPTTIWHLRECTGIFNTLKKHKWNLKKSEMHSKEELTKWYHKMIFGYYPTSIVRQSELPKIIREEFLI